LYKKQLVSPLLGIEKAMADYIEWEASLGESAKECDFQPQHESALKKLESMLSLSPSNAIRQNEV
jgi:hypothetical protein